MLLHGENKDSISFHMGIIPITDTLEKNCFYVKKQGKIIHKIAAVEIAIAQAHSPLPVIDDVSNFLYGIALFMEKMRLESLKLED